MKYFAKGNETLSTPDELNSAISLIFSHKLPFVSVYSSQIAHLSGSSYVIIARIEAIRLLVCLL